MTKLKREIGKTTLIFLTINSILGAGIFFLPGIGAAYAGPGSIISWIIASIIAILLSTYFAELVGMYPKAGGIYEYVKNAFGEVSSFVIGWITWLLMVITIALLIVGALLYLLPGLPIVYYVLISAVIVIFFNVINYIGVKTSTGLLLVFGIITIGVLLSLIIPGLPVSDISNFTPFLPMGILPIFIAVFFILETFIGWESTTFLAEEVRNAKKVMPQVLIYSTIIIVALALLVVFVSIGISGWEVLGNSEAPLASVFTSLFGMERVFSILMFVVIIGSAAGVMITSPRLLYAMSRDRVVPKFFNKISEKRGTPVNAIVFQTIASIAIVVIGVGSFEMFLSMMMPLVIISYSALVFCVIKLRKTKPNVHREYKAPIPFLGPVFITIVTVGMLIYWLISVPGSFNLFLMDMILIFLGVPLYLIIKLETDPIFVESFFDRFSHVWDKLFPFWYCQDDLDKVLSKIKPKKGDVVLDLGCATGITTSALAESVGNDGVVVAVDISNKQLEKAKKRLKRATKYKNVILVKERGLAPFDKNSFDAVTAVGVLEYFNKPDEVIKKLYTYLKPGGRFCFMSFGRSFGFPAPHFLRKREDVVKAWFKELGLDVKISKQRILLTDYWYIWGRKK